MTPEGLLWPFKNLFWPSLLRGALSQNATSAFFDGEPTPAFNIREALGLRGAASLLPLAALWAACAAVTCRRPGQRAARYGRTEQAGR